MDYKETMQLWKDAYRFCLGFDARIGIDDTLEQEEVEEYLHQKALLMLNLLKIFALESSENKNAYDTDYMLRLLEELKEEMLDEEIPMTAFDSNYMKEIIVEAKEDFEKAMEEDTE